MKCSTLLHLRLIKRTSPHTNTIKPVLLLNPLHPAWFPLTSLFIVCCFTILSAMIVSVAFNDTGTVLFFPHWRDVGVTAVPAKFYINVSYQINSLASETYFLHLPESLSGALNACNCSRLDLYPPNQMWLLWQQSQARLESTWNTKAPLLLSSLLPPFGALSADTGSAGENDHICILNIMLNPNDSLIKLKWNSPNTSLPGTQANSHQ